MSDLSVHPYRNGEIVIKDGFDIGAGPTIEGAIRDLEDLVEDGELDNSVVRRIAWMQDWEDLLLGRDEPRPGWMVEGEDVIEGVCDPKELANILATMATLRPRIERRHHVGWDALTTFLTTCAARGGSIALRYDPMG